MKKFIAIAVCKLAAFVGRLLGKGSSMPGKLALRICPDILSRLTLPERIVAVTGSNGKTSTVEMLVRCLTEAGQRVVWNKEGSNQIEGVTTMFLRACSLSGRVKCDTAVLESDEQYARHTFRYIRPTHFMILNLCRDQLTRNGHPEYVLERIAAAVGGDIKLILNADDPLVYSLAKLTRGEVVYFGVAKGVINDGFEPMYDDGRVCPECDGEMSFSEHTYGPFGHWSCHNCENKRPTPKYELTSLDLESGRMEINSSAEISSAIRTPFSVSNLLAAFAAASELGLDGKTSAKALSGYALKSGRLRTWKNGDKNITFLTAKHENSVSYDQSFAAAVKRGGDVLVIVDAVSRKYFTGETSWLYDINFSLLASERIGRVYLAGAYVNDLAMRSELAGIPKEKTVLLDSLDGMSRAFEESSELYVITCFADRDKFLSRLPETAKEGQGVC